MAIEQKIVVQNPVVELDGDEMTRIIWKKIREEVRFTMLFIVIFCGLTPFYASSSFLISNWTSNTMTSVWKTETRYVWSYRRRFKMLTTPDGRQSHRRLRRGDPEVRRRHQVCDHHAR